MANLTKRDMVVKISEEVGITQQQAFAVIQKTLEHITDSLAEGNNVELRNFGVFEVRLTKSRVGRNPNKPETDVVIPARATVKFKPGKIMRQRVLLRTEQLRQTPAPELRLAHPRPGRVGWPSGPPTYRRNNSPARIPICCVA